eukprot:gene25252-31685_t
MPPESSLPAPEPERGPRRRRRYNRYAIGLVILVHLALGTAVMLWNARLPSPKTAPRAVDVVLFETKVPETQLPDAQPEPSKAEPPPVEIPPMPDLPPVKLADTRTVAYLFAFLIFLACFCWTYAAASLVRVWTVLLGGGAAMSGAAWLLART